MELGMIGLGRMGANMTRRLQRAGHACVVYDRHLEAANALVPEGARAAATLDALTASLRPPRAVWMMVPAAAVEQTIAELRPRLAHGDVLIDGGNSYYRDSMRRAGDLKAAGLHYVDVGTSGGIWGLEQGFCLMLGGETEVVQRLDPIFRALAPGSDAAAATPGRPAGGTAERGYLHCGASGAGHFVKMVHNGIEYGLMAAYAEGINLLRHAQGVGNKNVSDAEHTPSDGLLDCELDVGEIAELWRRGSVVRSWLLDLAAHALRHDPELAGFEGYVADSGEGRWTIKAGIDAGVPLPVLSAALYARFSSRGAAEFGDKLLSALRGEFGGHRELPADGTRS